MRYRVTFQERTNGSGQPSEKPTDYLEFETEDGVVVDKNFVSRDEPQALHNEETLEEDDSFLSKGSETWDYDIADGRDKEFIDAVRKSRMVLDCVPLDDEFISA